MHFFDIRYDMKCWISGHAMPYSTFKIAESDQSPHPASATGIFGRRSSHAVKPLLLLPPTTSRPTRWRQAWHLCCSSSLWIQRSQSRKSGPFSKVWGSSTLLSSIWGTATLMLPQKSPSNRSRTVLSRSKSGSGRVCFLMSFSMKFSLRLRIASTCLSRCQMGQKSKTWPAVSKVNCQASLPLDFRKLSCWGVARHTQLFSHPETDRTVHTDILSYDK